MGILHKRVKRSNGVVSENYLRQELRVETPNGEVTDSDVTSNDNDCS